MHKLLRASAFPLAFAALLAAPTVAQVHYHADGHPWKQRAGSGPDAEVPGWFLNLGITGLRVQLVEKEPRTLLVQHVFAKTPAAGKIEVGDVLVGVEGKPFSADHQNGYGMKVFGAKGPIEEFAAALEACQAKSGKGVLRVTRRRGEAIEEVELAIGKEYGAFGPSYPKDCAKSEKIRLELLEFLRKQQREDGSFGDEITDTFAPLALLSNATKEDLAAVERNARWHAKTTKAEDKSGLINWRYMSAAIVLSELYSSSKAKWIVPELEEIYAFLHSSQYVDLSQVNPKAKESHPHSFPKTAMDAHGGWGHNPGFEGYGPIAMLTGQGALAYSLMKRCGVAVDRRRHDAAYAFLVRGTGLEGYVWYADEVASPKDWADHGRTGAAGIANLLSPYDEPVFRERALAHAQQIGMHPQSFPDTHGSPPMGMAYAGVAAFADPESFRKLMDANRWWFALAQCCDGTYYYQPNRDNAGYGADSRLTISAVVAFLFSLERRNLALSGR
jgi:hypothetical protein